jgi:hypothetical protein
MPRKSPSIAARRRPQMRAHRSSCLERAMFDRAPLFRDMGVLNQTGTLFCQLPQCKVQLMCGRLGGQQV